MSIPNSKSAAVVVGRFTGEWWENVGRRTFWQKEWAVNSEFELEVRPCREPNADCGGDCQNYGMAIMDDVRHR